MNNRNVKTSVFLVMALAITACAKTSDTKSGTSDAPPAPSEPVAALSVTTSWLDSDTEKSITFTNTGDSPIKVNQVVVNGLESDSDCNIKVFKTLAPKEAGTVNVPNCGRFTKFKVIGDTGSFETSVSQAQTDISVKDFTSEDKTIRVYNQSSNEYMLQKVIINKSENDSNCNVKVFQKIEAHSYVDVPQNCGAFVNAKLEFETETIEVGN